MLSPVSRHLSQSQAEIPLIPAVQFSRATSIEAGLADLNDENLKERMTSLKAIRDEAKAEAERLQVTLDSSGNQTITVDTLDSLSSAARAGLRLEEGGYRREHLRALAQRVEVADDEIRIMGSKSELLRTLVAASSGKSAHSALVVLY